MVVAARTVVTAEAEANTAQVTWAAATVEETATAGTTEAAAAMAASRVALLAGAR